MDLEKWLGSVSHVKVGPPTLGGKLTVMRWHGLKVFIVLVDMHLTLIQAMKTMFVIILLEPIVLFKQKSEEVLFSRVQLVISPKLHGRPVIHQMELLMLPII